MNQLWGLMNHWICNDEESWICVGMMIFEDLDVVQMS